MIEEIGVISAISHQRGNRELRINAGETLEGMKPGDSLSINGVCLTVTTIDSDGVRVEASTHTANSSTIKQWRIGKKVNLERAVMVGSRLGGHIVQGHVDGLGRVARIRYVEGATVIQFDLAQPLLKLLAPKGSVAVDGVSVTLAEKTNSGFNVMVIPYTLENTTLGELKPGDEVNIETDIIIRWLADRFSDGETVDNPLEKWQQSGGIHLED